MEQIDADINRLEQTLHAFFQTMKKPQRWAQITHDAGITLDRPAAMILHTLVRHEAEPLHLHELAQSLGIEPPSVTRKTQELVQAGYIERIPDPDDRRAVSFRVTPEGRSVSDTLHSVQRETLKQAFADWSPEDRQHFVALLERFSANLKGDT
jgi:DNA-binding MarR family transcriptional regulator